MGKFYGIGTGPGDSELLTIKAVKTLEKLDILYAPEPKKGGDSLAMSIVSEYLKDGLEIKVRHFPMTKNLEEKIGAWESISNEIIEDVRDKDKTVGFVTLGDPMIYSTYIYLLERLQGKIDIETIPGISSFSNISSNQNYPLVIDENELIIVPCTVGAERIDYALKNYVSVVLMKVYKNFKEIYTLIEKNNLLDHAIMVSNSSQDREEVYTSMRDVDIEKKVSYFSTILINKELDL